MKYIQNTHTAPITANTRDKAGRKAKSFTFLPAKIDKYTGATISTGYTAVEDGDYKNLVETSRVLKRYADDMKLLVVHDELPLEAMTPHEMLADTKRRALKLDRELKTVKDENERLKVDLYDAEKRYKELAVASTDEEKVKGFTEKISTLEAGLAELTRERDALKAENEKLNAKQTDLAQKEKNGKKGAGKDFE